MSGEPMAGDRDVFVSYAHADVDWVRRLVENLRESGLSVAFDEWDIGPGDTLIRRLDEMLLASRHGIIVVSPASMASSYVSEEYGALKRHASEKGRRLVAVLLRDATMPPLLANLHGADVRNADGPE